MKKNKFLQIISLFLLFCSLLQSSSNTARETFKGREWEFIQHEITKKKSSKIEFFANTAKEITSFFAPFIGSVFLATHIAKIDKNNPEKNYSVYVPVILITGMLTSSIFHHIIKTSNENKATLATYLDFIKNWSLNKPYCPESLHHAFDELYHLYQNHGTDSELFKYKYNELKEIIDEALYNRFPPPVVIYDPPQTIHYHYQC